MKPCPQCGHHQWFVNRIWSFTKRDVTYYVICKVCGTHGPESASESGAIENWNGSSVHIKSPLDQESGDR